MGPSPSPTNDSEAAMLKQQTQRQRKRQCILFATATILALIVGGITVYVTVSKYRNDPTGTSPKGPASEELPSDPADHNSTETDLPPSQPRVTAIPQIQFPISNPLAVRACNVFLLPKSFAQREPQRSDSIHGLLPMHMTSWH